MIYKSIDLEQVAVVDGCGTRMYGLSRGDEFTLNDIAIKQTFNMSMKKIKCGTKIDECFMCTKKIKRKHWWQFWKPKYWGASFIYLGEDKINELYR